MSLASATDWMRRSRTPLGIAGLVAIMALLAALTAGGITALQRTKYRANAVFVVAPVGTRADNEALFRTIEALAVSRPIADDIRQRSGLAISAADVQRRISVSRPPDSAAMTVSVLDTSRSASDRLARQVAPALAARVVDFGPTASAAGTTSPYRLVPISGAPDIEVIKPPVIRNTIIGLLLGLLVGAGLAALLNRAPTGGQQRTLPTQPPGATAAPPVRRPSPHPQPAARP